MDGRITTSNLKFDEIGRIISHTRHAIYYYDYYMLHVYQTLF